MNPQVQDILRHGYIWLFLAALLERLGLPLLVTPLVVAAGAVGVSLLLLRKIREGRESVQNS